MFDIMFFYRRVLYKKKGKEITFTKKTHIGIIWLIKQTKVMNPFASVVDGFLSEMP